MISGSLASAEAIAHIMTQKFVMASPLYRTGRDDGPPIVLHEYQPSRKAEHVEKFLEGFSGFLHADGCQGFRRLPENIRVAAAGPLSGGRSMRHSTPYRWISGRIRR